MGVVITGAADRKTIILKQMGQEFEFVRVDGAVNSRSPHPHSLFELPDHFRSDSDADVFIGLFQDERLVSTQCGFNHQDFLQVNDMCPGDLDEPGMIQFGGQFGQGQGRCPVHPVPAVNLDIAHIVLHIADVPGIDDDGRIDPVKLQPGTEGFLSGKQVGSGNSCAK